jgi:hypothetical protein
LLLHACPVEHRRIDASIPARLVVTAQRFSVPVEDPGTILQESWRP